MKTFRHVLLLALSVFITLSGVRPVHAAVVLDPSFQTPFFATPALAARVRLLPNGKFVVFFTVETLTDQPTGAITQYLPDGTLDPSFNFSQDYDSVSAATPLPNGQLLIAASQSIYRNSDGTERILRLNSDGSIDQSFNPNALTSGSANPNVADNSNDGLVREIALQPDGKILLAGFFEAFQGMFHPTVVRLLADGSFDPSFVSADFEFPSPTTFGLWVKPVIQTDGKILVAGDFSVVNGVAFPGIARLNSDGTLDNTFNVSGFTRNAPIRGLVLQNDGAIVIGGKFSSAGGPVPVRRLNADGTVDPGYVLSPAFFVSYPDRVRDAIIQPDGKVVTAHTTVARFNTDGTLDNTFRQPLLLVDRVNTDPAVVPEAFTINLQTDGKVLIGGQFTDVDDASGPANGSRFGVARFNSDGTLDNLTTSHRTGLKTTPTTFARQPDGLTLIAFDSDSLSSYDGTPAIPHNFARLLPNGAFDPSFNPFPGYAPNGALTPNFIAGGFLRVPDGKLFVGGRKSQGGPFTYGRLFSDGTEDVSFVPDPSITNLGDPRFQPDGKLLILSGDGDAQSVVDNKLLQRLTTAGAIDPSFHPDPQILADTVQRDGSNMITSVATGKPNVLAVFADGSFLLSYYALDTTWRLVRLTRDGTIDTSFQGVSVPFTGDSFPSTVIDPLDPGAGPQTVTEINANTRLFRNARVVDGNKTVIVGEFQNYRVSNTLGIVRINFDGSVDPTFQAGAGAQLTQTTVRSPAVRQVALEGDGRLLLIGEFDAFSGTNVPGIVSLNADGSVDSQFVAPVIANIFDSREGRLEQQVDGSFLLSGPYKLPNSSLSPVFVRLLGPPVITSPLAVAGTVGVPFTYQFQASGATSLGVSNLAPGLTFRSDLAAITGSPTSVGTFSVALSASNAAGTTNATLSITVQPAPPAGPTIISSNAATGRAGQPFRFQVLTLGGTTAARVNATGLPPGLGIDATTGIISGTPTAEGSSAVNLTVTDGAFVTTAVLQLTFTADPILPVITGPSSAALPLNQFFSYTIVAPGNPDPSDPTVFTLVGALPQGLSFDATTGTISGTYIGPFRRKGGPRKPDLAGGTLLGSVQLFATNSHGTSTFNLLFRTPPQGVVNISTRLMVGTGENVLIGGIIVTGNAPKLIIVRAIGPSLGIPGALQDPTLELHDSAGHVVFNDNWKDIDAQRQIIMDSGIPPADDRESAIVIALDPGAYTAIVAGKSGTTGIALVEAYDLGTASLDPSGNAKLANISTRGTVLTGDNVMIGGFIISGPATRIIARAIGPSLSGTVSGALQDTVLELRDGSGTLILANDDWRSTQEQEIIATGVPPTDDRESAIVATLNPGAYTGIVRGKDETTGVALVEVYALQ